MRFRMSNVVGQTVPAEGTLVGESSETKRLNVVGRRHGQNPGVSRRA